MSQINIQCKGFSLSMLYDAHDPDDQEIMAAVFELLRRRQKLKTGTA